MQPSSEASPNDDDIQIGDHIKVSSGEHNGKHGTVRWLDGRVLWFTDEMHVVQNTKFDLATLGIQVPMESVRRLHFPNVLKFMKERGYDVKPGDNVMIARGPHYDTTGTVQSVDFPNVSLKLKCDSNNTFVSNILQHTCYHTLNSIFCNRSTFLFVLQSCKTPCRRRKNSTHSLARKFSSSLVIIRVIGAHYLGLVLNCVISLCMHTPA